jgi:hypothetical protein
VQDAKVAPVQLHPLPATLAKVMPEGKESLTVTVPAVATVPVLLTVIV